VHRQRDSTARLPFVNAVWRACRKYESMSSGG